MNTLGNDDVMSRQFYEPLDILKASLQTYSQQLTNSIPDSLLKAATSAINANQNISNTCYEIGHRASKTVSEAILKMGNQPYTISGIRETYAIQHQAILDLIEQTKRIDDAILQKYAENAKLSIDRLSNSFFTVLQNVSFPEKALENSNEIHKTTNDVVPNQRIEPTLSGSTVQNGRLMVELLFKYIFPYILNLILFWSNIVYPHEQIQESPNDIYIEQLNVNVQESNLAMLELLEHLIEYCPELFPDLRDFQTNQSTVQPDQSITLPSLSVPQPSDSDSDNTDVPNTY